MVLGKMFLNSSTQNIFIENIFNYKNRAIYHVQIKVALFTLSNVMQFIRVQANLVWHKRSLHDSFKIHFFYLYIHIRPYFNGFYGEIDFVFRNFAVLKFSFKIKFKIYFCKIYKILKFVFSYNTSKKVKLFLTP